MHGLVYTPALLDDETVHLYEHAGPFTVDDILYTPNNATNEVQPMAFPVNDIPGSGAWTWTTQPLPEHVIDQWIATGRPHL